MKQTNKAASWNRSITYSYDENGNMVRKDTQDESFTTYKYDSENRLTAVQDGGALLFAALYDGNGDRVFTVAPRQNTGNWHDDWKDGRWAIAEPQNGYDDDKWVYGEDETQPTEATEVTQPTEVTEPTQPTEVTKPTTPTEPTEETKPATEPTNPPETKPRGEDDGSWWEGKYEGGNTGVDDGQWYPDGKPTQPTEPEETQPEPTNPDTSGIPAWDKDTVYLGGAKVIYNGGVYEAQWWTLGDVPGHVNEGPWKLVGEATQPTEPEETQPEETEPTEPTETQPTETEPVETEPVETFPVNGSANYDLGMIRDVLFVPNGIDTAYEEENYVLTGYINNINTQYTQVLAEYGNSGNYTNVYEYGVQRTSMYQNGQVYSYEYDGRGSVSELVNAIGDTQIKYSYGAYGETVSTVIGWNNPVTNPYRYNAERIDDVSGVPAFQYLRARYLNPYTSTFLTQDTYLGNLRTPLSQNRFTYAQNNPVMYADPSGHFIRQPATSMLMGSDGATGYAAKVPYLYEFTRGLMEANGVDTLLKIYTKNTNAAVKTYINQAIKEVCENIIAFLCSNATSSPPFTPTLMYSYSIHTGEPEDLNFADKSKSELTDMKWISWNDFVLISEPEYMFTWKAYAKLLSKGKLRPVLMEMIDHFSDGTGSEYSNPILTEEVRKHDNTKRYMEDFTEQFKEMLSQNGGDYLAFANSKDFNELLLNNDIRLPKYAYGGGIRDEDTRGGLTMAIHSWTDVRVTLTSFEQNGQYYAGTLEFQFSDNFGLDEYDLNKYGKFLGFEAWYILQHYDKYEGKYKPFHVIATIPYEFSGRFDE